jgi:hypothetical protein
VTPLRAGLGAPCDGLHRRSVAGMRPRLARVRRRRRPSEDAPASARDYAWITGQAYGLEALAVYLYYMSHYVYMYCMFALLIC